MYSFPKNPRTQPETGALYKKLINVLTPRRGEFTNQFAVCWYTQYVERYFFELSKLIWRFSFLLKLFVDAFFPFFSIPLGVKYWIICTFRCWIQLRRPKEAGFGGEGKRSRNSDRRWTRAFPGSMNKLRVWVRQSGTELPVSSPRKDAGLNEAWMRDGFSRSLACGKYIYL